MNKYIYAKKYMKTAHSVTHIQLTAVNIFQMVSKSQVHDVLGSNRQGEDVPFTLPGRVKSDEVEFVFKFLFFSISKMKPVCRFNLVWLKLKQLSIFNSILAFFLDLLPAELVSPDHGEDRIKAVQCDHLQGLLQVVRMETGRRSLDVTHHIHLCENKDEL